ncbi:protein ACCELERATED CELL DEATH 6-like [Actinidia eriantha]|uniref:protein ACCELERATED CELL DEATH 6-like n=1 Tax=Actinidia eriantha TaxID=165200 RepID=UPI0025897D17|nr:protein ACCELERATED CELL DEATH 6-like [Actinidia eriantha]XP_057511621.1 protein ACCELERATED CELL DEATH 6-like [Actinidia eriantha]
MEIGSEWQPTLSIQLCFPAAWSGPCSGGISKSTNSSTIQLSQGPQPNSNGHTRSSSIQGIPVDERTDVKERMVILDMPPQYPPVGSSALTNCANGLITIPSGNEAIKNLSIYVPLYQAALKGDWEKAKKFIALHPAALSARITKGRDTVLHIAAGAKQTKFVEELVNLMDARDLELKNNDDNTALCFAAASGQTRIAEVMVAKNKILPSMRGSKGVTALHMAALLGHRDMVWYLISVTTDEDLTKEDYIGLLIATIGSDLFDVALHIIHRHPKLAIERHTNGETALHVLARKTSAFSGKNGLGIWKKFIYSWIYVRLPKGHGYSYMFKYQAHKIIHDTHFFSRLLRHAEEILGIKEVQDKKVLHMQCLQLLRRLWEQILELDDLQIRNLLKSPLQPTFIAAECGNFEFVFELLHSYPDLIWKVDDQSRSIFHIAVMHRQEKIFQLIYDIGAHKDLITAYNDKNNTNMLHLAGKLAPCDRLNIVSGAALQMQRELLWFKEVEKNVQPSYKEMKDMEGQTPRKLFAEEHKALVKAGERWMKDTASSCMLVATLITTVMFAAIFTVPGGNRDTGTPIFLKVKSFIVFTISDAFALFSSVTSILMFLAILTSRYAEEDFLETLPKRLIIGFTTLFFSIASMLIAFTAAFFIVLSHQLGWIVIPVALAACIPVTLFAFLQFPLLADIFHSTYGSGIFSRRNRNMLY